MMRSMLRYDSRAAAGPMWYASSAFITCKAARSTSENTATVGMPSSRQARITRTAISPRLATRIFLNSGGMVKGDLTTEDTESTEAENKAEDLTIDSAWRSKSSDHQMSVTFPCHSDTEEFCWLHRF